MPTQREGGFRTVGTTGPSHSNNSKAPRYRQAFTFIHSKHYIQQCTTNVFLKQRAGFCLSSLLVREPLTNNHLWKTDLITLYPYSITLFPLSLSRNLTLVGWEEEVKHLSSYSSASKKRKHFRATTSAGIHVYICSTNVHVECVY